MPLSTRDTHHTVFIHDQPCGTGKTTTYLKNLSPDRQYLIVAPFLSEVDRVIKHASVPFVAPSVDTEVATKEDSLSCLLLDGVNVVTTHALYDRIVSAAEQGFLDGYDIIVDEVLDVVRQTQGVSELSWSDLYIKTGYATVDPDGKVNATPLWDACHETVKDTLKEKLYRQAKAGTLYKVGSDFFLWAMPRQLLQAGKSITIYTYLAEGSMLLPYLRKLGIKYHHHCDVALDVATRIQARDLIDIRSIPALERMKWSFTGQTSKAGDGRDRKIGRTLDNLRKRKLAGAPLSLVMLTCVKENWFKDGDSKPATRKPGPYAKLSRMFNGVRWVANTTRGTNDYIHCTTAVYLWDQHLVPHIKLWLGLGGGRDADDRYATTELIQWLYRTAVRKGEKITVYIPSKRMRELLIDWLNNDT